MATHRATAEENRPPISIGTNIPPLVPKNVWAPEDLGILGNLENTDFELNTENFTQYQLSA